MIVKEILQSAQFLVDRQGKATGVVLTIDAWEAILTQLEDVEDVELAQERLKGWRTKEGWARWEDFEVEMDADAVPTMD